MNKKHRNTSSKLRHLMLLQEEVRAADGAGGFTRSWKDVAEIWAEIAPASGKEKIFSMQMHSTLMHRVTMRYREDVRASQRLVFDNRAFYIRYVVSLGYGNELLELFVEENKET